MDKEEQVEWVSDDKWYHKKYNPSETLNTCERCGNFYGEYKNCTYGCVHHPIPPVQFDLYKK